MKHLNPKLINELNHLMDLSRITYSLVSEIHCLSN